MANGFQLRPVQTDPGAPGRGLQTGLQLGGTFQAGRERRRESQRAEAQRPLALQQQQLPFLVEGARRVNLVQDPQAKLSILNTMRGNFERAGLSTDVLDQGIQQLQSGDVEGFQKSTDQLIALGQQLSAGGRGAPSTKAFAPVPTVGPEGQRGLAIPTFDPATQQAGLQPVPLGEEIQLVKESAQEKREGELELATSKERGKLIARQRQEIRTDINKGARESRRQLPRINKLLEGLDAVKTGKLAQAKLIFGPFIPGVDPTNEQALASQINDLVLDVLSRFPGAISEGERAFAERTTANLGFTPEANRIILKRLTERLGSAIEEENQFKKFIKGGGRAEDFEFDVGELAEEASQLFSSSLNKQISEQDIQDTLAANPGLTRDQLLQRLGVQ